MSDSREDDGKVRKIRAAARALFLRDGFGRVSTAALAREAGVSKETLYSRFPSKDAVLSDLLGHLIHLDPSEPAVARPVATRAELEGGLLAFAHEFVSHLMQPDYVELVRVVIAESPRMPHLGQLFRQAVPERALQRVVAMLAGAQHAGLVDDGLDLAVAARMFVGPLVMQVVLNRLLVAAPDATSATANLDIAAHVSLFLGGTCPFDTPPGRTAAAPRGS